MGEARSIRSHIVSPHSTPTPKAAQARASLRPPVFNPYDRFTQPEFDAWIGDITSTLKRALNHEAEPEVDSPSRHSSSWNTIPDQIGSRFGAEGRPQSPGSSEAHDEESALEDSFAQIASRRAKGKARDPREGPGLGLKGQPIELLSDSEEEEVVDSLEVGSVFSDDSDEGAREGSSGETDYVESELDEGGEANSGWPGTSTQQIVAASSSGDSGHDREVAGRSCAEALDTADEDLRFPRNTEAFRGDDVDGNEGFAVLRNREGTDDESFPTQIATAFDVEIVDPWDAPRTFAEDYYSGGDRLALDSTPNHLTPIARSPASAIVLGLLTVSSTNAPEDGLSPSPSMLSSNPSPKPQGTADGDQLDGPPLFCTTVASSVNDQRNGDQAEVVGGHVHIVGDTETEVVGSANSGTKGRDSDQGDQIIWVPPSDDELSDADGEEDAGEFLGVAPLGTSDLDIRDNWFAAGRRKDFNNMSEEDELQEVVSSRTADDVAKTVALTLSQFSEVGHPSDLDAPLVDPQVPILASTFQLTDADSFGDLPLSSPPSETPSPAPAQPTGAFELQRHSIEQLLADLEREASEKRSQVSESPGSLDRQPEAETENVWASRELENILSSGEISIPDNVSGTASTGPNTFQEVVFSTQYPEYVVEEAKCGTEVLPDDDFGDTRSVPPPDLAEVAEAIQPYEVEEPRTDGRLTEEPETTIKSSHDDGTTIPHLIVSSVENTAIPITSEQHVYSSHPTEGPSQPPGGPADDASQVNFFLAVPNIPAPIVADPSVPDPVPGDSTPPSPVVMDSPNASGLSAIPPAVLRAFDLDPSQISSGTSGLFTPAQRSEGDTPVRLEDEVSEVVPTISHNGADEAPATTSIPLRTEDDPSYIERFITGDEDGGDAEDRNAVGVDDPSERPQQVSPNERHLGIGTVVVDAQDPAFERVDEISSPPGRGSTKLAASQLSKDNLFTISTSSEIPPKVFSEHPSVLVPSGEGLLRNPSIVEGDEDADGEADPDYSPTRGAKNYQNPAHQSIGEDGEIISSKISNDTVTPKKTAAVLENLPESPSVPKQELDAVGGTSSDSLVDTSPTLQDNPITKSGDVQPEVEAGNGRESQTQALKRKRRDPNPGSVRITRSKSGVGAQRGKKASSSHRAPATSEKVQSERIDANTDGHSIDDGASESASASSGTSAVYCLLRGTSRAGSVESSASGDTPWTPAPMSGLGRVIPLVHSHGLHHHGWPVPPPFVSPTPSIGPHKGTRPEQARAKSPTPTSEPSTPSLKRAPSINSPVTRSNCRFRKISLPRGEDGMRAYFVVPGCALGNGELMHGEDIRDEGFSTHEDHKRMLPDVESLDLNPYLVGALRQLVGVDLLREQQEIFYLPSEEEKPRKRRQKGALESLRQFQRQSISNGGPVARDRSLRPSDVSQGRDKAPRSHSESVVSGSVREESVVHSEDWDSALSNPDDDDDDDDDDDLDEAPLAKRRKSSAVEMDPPLENTLTEGELGSSVVQKSSTPTSGKPPATRRSKRRTLNSDAAAYKPSEDEVKEDEEVEETKRRSGTRKATKRSRTMEETSAKPPRSKKTRLGRSISVAGAGAMDS